MCLWLCAGLKFILRFTDFGGCRDCQLDFVRSIFMRYQAKEMIKTSAAILLFSGKIGFKLILQTF